jgi:hypothetical protein
MHNDQPLSELRERVRREFPAQVYTGKITNYDNELDDPNRDDEKIVYDALIGKRWTEIPNDFLRAQPDGHLFLTDEAFLSFIAAWLLGSLEDVDGENPVREFLAYFFSSPGFFMYRLRLLTPTQRDVVRSILTQVSLCESSSFIRRHVS